MRAAQFERYGKPDVLRVVEVDRPRAGRSRAIVEVRATSVNPVEARVRAGVVRALTGWWFPKGTGLDFIGDVVEAGPGYRGPGIGQRVWGFLPGLPDGKVLAAAEFVSVKSGWLSRAPRGDNSDLGAMPLVASTAFGALTRTTKLRRGERVLVRGASGGVGSAAVQLGKALGAHVTGLASAGNLDFVRRLGADVALDYRVATPATISERFDVVLDLVGEDMSAWRGLMAPRGRFATTAAKGMGYTLATQVLGRSRIRPIVSMPRSSALAALAVLADSGDLTPSIAGRFTLGQIAEAHSALEAGRGPGKVLITLS